MKNFSRRRRGTVLAAAALSVALVAPFTQPIAGAQNNDAATTTITTTAAADKRLKFDVSGADGTEVTVTFTTSKGTKDVTAKIANKRVEVEVPSEAIDGLVTIKSGDKVEKINVKLGKPAETPSSSSSSAAKPSTSETPSASTSSSAAAAPTSSESSTTKATTSESSKETTPSSSSAKETTSSSKASESKKTTAANGLSSALSNSNMTCESAILGWGIPLALLLPIGVIATVAIPGLEGLTQAYSEAVRNANAELQNQLGIMNPELSRQVAVINDQLRIFGTDLAQVAVGSVLIGVGAGAIANIASACSGTNGASQERGSSVWFRVAKTGTTTTSKTTEPTASTTASKSAEATTSAETTTSAAAAK